MSYYLECRKYTESKNPKAIKTKSKRIIFSSNCALCSSKKSRFIKEQETCGLLSSLGISTPLSQIPLVGPLVLEV